MIKALFESEDDLLGLTIYALLVTVIAVAATMLITRATNKAKAALTRGKNDEE